MKTISTKRISPTIPVALEPEIKAYIAKRVAEFKANVVKYAELRKYATAELGCAFDEQLEAQKEVKP